VDAGDITDLIEDCVPEKDRLVEIQKVEMEGCDAVNDDRCNAIIGDTAKGKIHFLVNTEKITQLDCKLTAQIPGVKQPIPWACPEKDGCKSLEKGDNLVDTCPLKKNDHVVYDVSIKVPGLAPAGVYLTGTWKLSDGGKTAVCIEIPMIIKRPSYPQPTYYPTLKPTSRPPPPSTTRRPYPPPSTTRRPYPPPSTPRPSPPWSTTYPPTTTTPKPRPPIPGLGLFATMIINASNVDVTINNYFVKPE